MFDGEDAENTWWEYMVKTKVIAEKYKWMSAIESNVVNPTTKEQKTSEAAGKHWFVMTCKGEALQSVRIHHDKGSVQDIWNELKQTLISLDLWIVLQLLILFLRYTR
jgi:hypothetical protein